VLVRHRFAVDQPDPLDHQLVARLDRGATSQGPERLNRATQLLAQLAHDRLGSGLARVDLAAWKLPAAGDILRTDAARGQHPAVQHQRGTDHGGHGCIGISYFGSPVHG
jgi:hypothetical protein